MTRDEIPARVATLLGKPVRWATPKGIAVAYDGCERTLDVFCVDANQARGALRAIRVERADYELAAGGPLVFVFHTEAETRRLYPDALSGVSDEHGSDNQRRG